MKEGDIITLGEHRLMCGDATKDIPHLLGGASVNLVLTDPPYGINIVKVNNGTIGGGKIATFKKESVPRKSTIGGTGGAGLRPFKERESNLRAKSEVIQNMPQDLTGTVGIPGIVQPREYYPVLGDDKPFNPEHLLRLDCPLVLFGANNYASKLPDNSKWLVWHKNPSLNRNRNNFSDCELAWTNFDGKSVICYHHAWSGMVRQGDRRLELEERIHPTQKPVGLLKEIILDYTEPNDVILDCYGGSGSTLIACEETARKCFMMELSPYYCDLIVERYNDLYLGQTKLV